MTLFDLPAMNVTPGQVLSRGLRNCCPNCGSHTLFQAEARFRINPSCPQCGLKFDRGDGFFLGPFIINYSVTVCTFVVPVILLYVFHVFGPRTTLVAAAVGTFGLPILLYRLSWSWWLMTYFFFLPQKLPANRGTDLEDEEE
jgi:uncharacterized protein (DUF983 family)